MPRIVRDIQLLVNDDDDHLYGYRLSDGTEVRIGTSRPDNAAAVLGAAGPRSARGVVSRGQASRRIALKEARGTGVFTLSATGGVVTETFDSASPIGPAIKLDIGSGVTQLDITTSGFSLPSFTAGQGKMVWLCAFSDPRAISQIQAFYGTNSLSASLRYDYKMANSAIGFLAAGPAQIDIHPDIAGANTLSTSDTVTTSRLRVQRSASASSGLQIIGAGAAPSATATTMWVRGVYLPANEDKPFVILTFDDANRSWQSFLQPLLAQYGFRATFNVYQSAVGTNDALFINTTDMASLYADGHEFSSHNVTNTAYTVATAADYIGEFRTCRDWLRSLGYRDRLDFHAYVQGLYNMDTAIALQQEGVRYARGVQSFNFDPMLCDQATMSMPVLGLGNTFTLAQAQSRVQSAMLRGQDTIIMGHDFASASSDTTTWSFDNMRGFIAWLADQVATGNIGGVGHWGDYLQYRGIA